MEAAATKEPDLDRDARRCARDAVARDLQAIQDILKRYRELRRTANANGLGGTSSAAASAIGLLAALRLPMGVLRDSLDPDRRRGEVAALHG